MDENLIPQHGGYRKLKSFQIAQLVFDVTRRFCDRFIGQKSRTHDQMVQAARSGVQNIAEGSQASASSKKTELTLTNVARSSLEELKLDYQDFLRQGGFKIWENDPRAWELIGLRLETANEYARWSKFVSDRDGIPLEEVAANGVLVLLSVACKLLNKQLAVQAESFQKDGGFSERLYRMRSKTRQ